MCTANTYSMNKLYDSEASKSRHSKESCFLLSICLVFGQWFSLAWLFAQEMLKKLLANFHNCSQCLADLSLRYCYHTHISAADKPI